MILQWKPFKVHLPAFCEFLRDNVSKSNGIVAYDTHCEIMESEPFTQGDIEVITTYYASLTSNEEESKITREARLIEAIHNIRRGLLVKDLANLTLIERKILTNIELTLDEEDEILGVY